MKPREFWQVCRGGKMLFTAGIKQDPYLASTILAAPGFPFKLEETHSFVGYPIVHQVLTWAYWQTTAPRP